MTDHDTALVPTPTGPPPATPTPVHGAAVLVLALVAALAASLLGTPPALADQTFGDDPLDRVLAAAAEYGDDCSNSAGRLSRDRLAALVLAPTFPETGAPTTLAPSPMTLSRWDNQSTLYSYGNPGNFEKAFWHPGIGPWQWDDASGYGLAASERIDSGFIVAHTTAVIADRWCSGHRLSSVWGPWHGCSNGRCEAIYRDILRNGNLVDVVRDDQVSRRGGMQARTCTNGSAETFRCWYVDPDRAQGYRGFLASGFGPAPVTAPFYTFRAGGREHRHWLRVDTGYGRDIRASLASGANSRPSGNLAWRSQSSLCDLTASRGDCDWALPPDGFDLAFDPVSGSYDPVTGDFDGDGRDDVLWYAPGKAADSVWYGRAGGFATGSLRVDGDYRPVAGDFDGDGIDDVLWYAPGPAVDSVWYGSGSGFDSVLVDVRGSYEPVTGDLDEDGRDDVYWYAPGKAADSVWYGRSVGAAFHGVRRDVDGLYRPVVGDFDGRAGDDVLWYGIGSRRDWLWYSTGSRTRADVRAIGVSGTYRPVAGDVDDDGDDDLLWYADGPATDWLWRATGSAFSSTAVRIDQSAVPLVGDFDGRWGDDVFFYRVGAPRDFTWMAAR